MNERLETLAGIYAAAAKVYINDIVHALTIEHFSSSTSKNWEQLALCMCMLVMLTTAECSPAAL